MANGESVADPVRTVCQAHWTAPATLAHHPARLARRTAQFGQAGAGGPRYRLFSPRSSSRQPLALLCPPKYPTSYAFRLPDEQAQETPEFSPAPRLWLDELDPESLSWCVWGGLAGGPALLAYLCEQSFFQFGPPHRLMRGLVV